jgi:hypothetical protein
MIEDVDDTSALYKAMYQKSKEKREANRAGSAKLLDSYDIPYKSMNGGTHLIIQYENQPLIIDFWPGTGLWIVRHRKPEYRKRGVRPLINYIQNHITR